jgi:hypothetical protein
VAGTSYRREALRREGLRPGAHVRLRPEPHNEHDPNAIGVWDPSANTQLGYIPRELSPILAARVAPGGALNETFGGVVITEYRQGSENGPRVGLHILLGPVGDLNLQVRSAGDDDDDPAFAEAVESFKARNDSATLASGMTAVTCPACGSTQQAFEGVGGFRCTTCQRDVWIINCRRCHNACSIYGSATGAGALVFRCGNCRAKNTVEKGRLRAISAAAQRAARAEAAARREAAAQAAAREKTMRVQHIETLQEEAARQNRELHVRVESMR